MSDPSSPGTSPAPGQTSPAASATPASTPQGQAPSSPQSPSTVPASTGTTPPNGTGAPGSAKPSSPPSSSESPTTHSPPAGEQRPEFLPEKFWQDGKPNYEALATSYRELERKQFQRREDIRMEIRTELNAEARKGVPNSPGDYQLRERKAPDGTQLTVDTNDPAFGFISHEAHRFGLNDEQFNDLLDRWLVIESHRGPDWNKEKSTLGENADLRLQRISTWAKSAMPKEAYEVFAELPASAKMVTLFESVMLLHGQKPFTPVTTAEGTATYAQGTVTAADLKAAMADPKYWRDNDPAYIAKVKGMARQIAGSG